MPNSTLLRSRFYRLTCAAAFALLAYVVARAPLWNPAMAGARVEVGGEHVVLVAPAWQCSEYPYVCSTTICGGPLVAQVGAFGVDDPVTCSATFRGQAVACNTRFQYAPGPKPQLQIGALPGVTFASAMLERPWRWLDLGLLDESGPLHVHSGIACALLLALGAAALLPANGLWWLARVATASVTFVMLFGAWFLMSWYLGYVD